MLYARHCLLNCDIITNNKSFSAMLQEIIKIEEPLPQEDPLAPVVSIVNNVTTQELPELASLQIDSKEHLVLAQDEQANTNSIEIHQSIDGNIQNDMSKYSDLHLSEPSKVFVKTNEK
jgi:hypothetical protein